MEVENTEGTIRGEQPTTLATFVGNAVKRANSLAASPCAAASQRELLGETVSQVCSTLRSTEAAQPLTLMYLLLRAWGKQADERAEHVAAAALLYFCAGDLIDDIQDSDLSGKPHEHVGMPIAVNNGLTLVVLLLDSLRHGMALEPDRARSERYLEAFLRNGLHSLGCQHEDIEGVPTNTPPSRVLELQMGKAISISTLMEFGALLAGCDESLQQRYSRAGRHLAGMVQIVDDLRDIFGKDESPDLRDGKMTYPLACFLDSASTEQRETLERLRLGLPETMPEIRELFYDSGAVERCADTLDELRRGFHEEIAATGNHGAQHRLLLSIADALAETVYSPEPLPETDAFFSPDDEFSLVVRNVVRRFMQHLAELGLPQQPRLIPWHLPHFEYDPERRTIFYPDLGGLGEEVLPFHAALYGVEQTSAARDILFAAAPVLMPHEMFHFLRHQQGRLTEDRWHEEYVANRLAVAYGQRFCPDVLARAVADVQRVLVVNEYDSDSVEAILARCSKPSEEPRGYEVDPVTASAVHARMVQKFAALRLDLDDEVQTLLGLRKTNLVAAE